VFGSIATSNYHYFTSAGDKICFIDKYYGKDDVHATTTGSMDGDPELRNSGIDGQNSH
jgi:hypothetical protein